MEDGVEEGWKWITEGEGGRRGRGRATKRRERRRREERERDNEGEGKREGGTGTKTLEGREGEDVREEKKESGVFRRLERDEAKNNFLLN